MSDRQVDVRPRRWKNVQTPLLKWRLSKKGNDYAEIANAAGEQIGILVVVEMHGKYIFSILSWKDKPKSDAKWRSSVERYETREAAREAAVRAYEGAPVALVDAPPETRGRRIVL